MSKEKSTKMQPYKDAHAKCLPLETDDMSALLDMTIERCTARLGRPCHYTNDKKGLDDFINCTTEYFEYVNNINKNPDMERKLIPDIENWAVYLGITRQTIFHYEQRGGEWEQTISYYKNAIASIKKQLALNYKIPPMIYVFDATNNHGYVNSNEFKLTTPITEEYDRQSNILEREIKERGLIWNDETKEYEPMRED